MIDHRTYPARTVTLLRINHHCKWYRQTGRRKVALARAAVSMRTTATAPNARALLYCALHTKSASQIRSLPRVCYTAVTLRMQVIRWQLLVAIAASVPPVPEEVVVLDQGHLGLGSGSILKGSWLETTRFL